MTLCRVAEALPRAIRLIGWPKLVIFCSSACRIAFLAVGPRKHNWGTAGHTVSYLEAVLLLDSPLAFSLLPCNIAFPPPKLISHRKAYMYMWVKLQVPGQRCRAKWSTNCLSCLPCDRCAKASEGGGRPGGRLRSFNIVGLSTLPVS